MAFHGRVVSGQFGLPTKKQTSRYARYAFLVFPLHFILFCTYIAWRFRWEYSFNWLYAPIYGFKWLCQILFYNFGAPQTVDLIVWQYLPTLIVTGVLYRIIQRGRVENKIDILRGSAHFAVHDEIKSAGLFQKTGAVVGGWRDPQKNVVHKLFHSGPEHILVCAPTRSGKGISLVIPTLLTWPESVFVLDIKGENFVLSSGYRKTLGNVIKFEPSDPTGATARYNPLLEVHLDEDEENKDSQTETRDVQIIAQMIVDPDGKGMDGPDSHWQKTAYALLQGVITHVLYKGRRENKVYGLGDVYDALRKGDNIQLGTSMLKYNHLLVGTGDGSQNDRCHPIVKNAALEIMQKDPREASSVISTAISYFGLWMDKTIRKNTGDSTFRLSDLVNADNPTSLYLVIPPSDLVRLRPLLRLMVSQLVDSLTQKMESNGSGGVKSQNKHKILLMLDEFPTLKKLDKVQTALAYMGGYGAKAFIICQSLRQLTDIYGKDETVSANCHIHVFFAPNDDDTAKALSERCGKVTVTTTGTNYTGQPFRFGLSESRTTQIQHDTRELLTPDEIKRLTAAEKDEKGLITKPGSMLIFAAGIPPIYGEQTPYFFDADWDKRRRIAPAEKSDVLYLASKHLKPVPEEQKQSTSVPEPTAEEVEQQDNDDILAFPDDEQPEPQQQPSEVTSENNETSGADGTGTLKPETQASSFAKLE